MSDSESIKKMLRSVLQSSKEGVSISSLQSEYRSLCGEAIPLKKLGYSELEDYLRSIPSVVHMEYRMGEIKCFAAVCQETAHIAELVAKQKSSKKSGRSQVVNCRMRFKPSNPYVLNVRPRSSLRQPSAASVFNWIANCSRPHGSYSGCSASGDYRQLDQKLSPITPVEHRIPTPPSAVKRCVIPDSWKEKSFANCQKPTEKPPEVSRSNRAESCLYNMELVQGRITQLLEKYSSGLWMSSLSKFYTDMFKQKLHPQVLIDLKQWTHICTVEKSSSTNQADCLVYPPLPPKPKPKCNTTLETSPTCSSTVATRLSLRLSSTEQPSTAFPPPPVCKARVSPQNPLAKPTFIFPLQPTVASSDKMLSSVTTSSSAHSPADAPQLPLAVIPASGRCEDHHNLPTTALNHTPNSQPLAASWTTSAHAPSLSSSLQPGPDVVPLSVSPTSDSSPCPPSKSSAVISAEAHQRIKELMSKYTHGLWAHALPKLFMSTYKTPFPEHILDNLSLLLDICNVEYPVPHNKKRAILYYCCRAGIEATDGQKSQQSRRHPLPSGVEVSGPELPPCLVLPSEQYPSVLITDARSSSAVTVRYVGESYSNAQEVMEDAMLSFYSQSFTHCPLPNPVVGQLVAVRGEDGDELARAQVVEVIDPKKVKVYYVDYGFFVETSGTNLLELHQDFLFLPFQATNVRLAGLEAFSSHPLVLSSLDKLAVGKILLMETLEPCQGNEMPMVVLYDTSQDDDININSACLKALQDKTLNNPLTVNSTYQDVCVTNVCEDGIIYCQLPSRGTSRLNTLLKETEVIFTSEVTSDSLVSRPFSGKSCLAQYKGKWSRVRITNMHGNRVMEIFFIDLGVPATVEVTDLREFPPLFLKEFTIIPPQATKCRLADLAVPEGDWSPGALQWVKEAVLGSEDCKMKISKIDQDKEDWLVYVYLFIDTDSQALDKSINHQLWRKLATCNSSNTTLCNNSSKATGLSVLVEKLTLDSQVPKPIVEASTQPLHEAGDLTFLDTTTKSGMQSLLMPPPLELPQPGQNIDVFVPVACHPGHFVLQQWQDLHKLMVLMGEMILSYNQTWKNSTVTNIKKGEICAAKIDKNWHRVQVKGILANGLVSVYELDHGKHELVHKTLLQPLIDEFKQLPFQAITAQLAGVTQQQWSEEASMLFRNHVENRALVAQVDSVQDLSEVKGELWERRLTVYLVDTAVEDRDLWIHSIMADIGGELSSAG